MELALTVAVGVLVGIVSALFGIGGGLLAVPYMALVLGFDQHLAQGTSLAVIIPTALAGAIAHHKRGYVDMRIALFLAIGGVVGVSLGSRIALATTGDTLRLVFAFALIGLGARFIVQGARRPQSEQAG